MLRLRSEIHGAAEYVEDAPVHVVAHFVAEVGIKRLGVAASQFRHVANSQPVEIRGYRRSDAGDAQQIVPHLSDHTASSFPLGSVK
jgi:hypothetical protein